MTVVFYKFRRRVRVQKHFQGRIERLPYLFHSVKQAQKFVPVK